MVTILQIQPLACKTISGRFCLAQVTQEVQLPRESYIEECMFQKSTPENQPRTSGTQGMCLCYLLPALILSQQQYPEWFPAQ